MRSCLQTKLKWGKLKLQCIPLPQLNLYLQYQMIAQKRVNWLFRCISIYRSENLVYCNASLCIHLCDITHSKQGFGNKEVVELRSLTSFNIDNCTYSQTSTEFTIMCPPSDTQIKAHCYVNCRFVLVLCDLTRFFFYLGKNNNLLSQFMLCQWVS